MNKQNFDAGWEITEAQGMMMMRVAKWQPVTLPHDASIAKARSEQHPSGSGGGYAWGGVLTYRKKFSVLEAWKGGSVQLEFEGVYMNAEVSINGQLAALHPYGYTSFLVDLAPYLKFGAENEVVVAVNNGAQPNSRWYSGTGIYRHVWLRTGGGVHIQPWGVFITTPQVGPDARVVVATELANSGAGITVKLCSRVLDATGQTVAQAETALGTGSGANLRAEQLLKVADARLWSLEDPYLYILVSEVVAGGVVLDAERTTFGIRTIAVDARNGFRLNGIGLKMKGGCVHHDNGLLGAASYDRAEERKIELMKASGYNAVRCAHNPPAPAMLEACDRLGMLVIDETFDCWRMGKNPNDYHVYFEDWWQRDTEAMVRRDRNHPSIVMWSIGNEVPERTGVSDGYAWCRKQADLVRALDGTRPVTSAVPFLFEENIPAPEGDREQMFDLLDARPAGPETDRWGRVTKEFCDALDVTGYNYLERRYAYDSEQFPQRVMCGTETWPHRAFDFWTATQALPQVIGDFVWTSIDYLGESGIGQVTLDGPMQFFGRYPAHLANCGDIDICGFKRPQSYYRDILWGVRTAPYLAVLPPQYHGRKISFNPWGWEPVVNRWDFPGAEGQPTRVEVYSAAEEVELWVNGVSAGRKPAGAAQKNKAVFEVVYQPGKLAAAGLKGGVETGRTELVTAGAPAGLRLTPDRSALAGAAGDLAYVTAAVVDADGAAVQYAEHEISFEISGPGELIALGAANPTSEELYVGSRRRAFEGRLMAVVRTTGQPGQILLKASAAGLSGAETTLTINTGGG